MPKNDDGLFGPRSVTWRIHSDPSMMIGGLRALLVQALDPLAMAAVAQHSRYRDDPWARLIATTRYIMETTFGDTATAEAAAAKVRAIHRRVHGIDDFTGLPYRAEDPELLLWIHAVEVHSFMTGFRYFGGDLTGEDEDAYVREMIRAAELVGLEADSVPATHGELRDYLRSKTLVASPAARAAMRFVLFPPVAWPGGRYPNVPGARLLAVPGRIGWAIPTAAAVAILPQAARRAYGLPWMRPALPSLRISFAAFVATLNLISPPPPEVADVRSRARSDAA